MGATCAASSFDTDAALKESFEHANVSGRGRVLTQRLMSGTCMRHRDRRLETLTEALTNIRIVKLCGMEADVHAAVSAWRARELAELTRFQLGVAALISFITAGPKLASLSTFLCFTLALGRTVTPAVAFTMLALLSALEAGRHALVACDLRGNQLPEARAWAPHGHHMVHAHRA